MSNIDQNVVGNYKYNRGRKNDVILLDNRDNHIVRAFVS